MGTVFIAITILLSVFALSAQTPIAKRAFDEGTRLAGEGSFEKAAKRYRTAAMAMDEAETAEFAVKVHYNLGVCYYRTGQPAVAAKELNTAIRLSGGRHQRAYYALGMTESALENWPAARSAFLKAVELSPDDGEAWFDLAFVYLALRDYEAAAAAFRRSIDNRSVDAALGHNNLGVIMAMNSRFADAAEQFRRALEMSNGSLAAAKWNLDFCRAIDAGKKRLVAATQLNFARRGRII